MTSPLLKGYTIDRLAPTIYNVAWSPDLGYIATGDNNKQILIWQIEPDESNFSGDEYKPAKLLDLLEKGFHRGIVRALAWAPNGKRLASGGSDHDILIWDINFDVEARQSPTKRLRGHADWVTSFAWISDERLLSGSRDTEIFCWNPVTGDELLRFTNANHIVTCMFTSPDNTYLAVGSEDGVVRVYDWMAEKLLLELPGHSERINSVAWSPSGVLASASSDRDIRLWNVSNFQNIQVTTLSGHKKDVLAVSFSPDGKLLASQSSDMTLRFWDVELGQPIDFKEWECSAHPNTGMGFDRNMPMLISLGKKDHVFRVWKVSVEAMLRMYQQRSEIDNAEWNRLEHGLIRTKDGAANLHRVVYESVEEAGFLPVYEGRSSSQKFYELAKESDFLVRIYSDVDDLFGYYEEINAFSSQDKQCYLFCADELSCAGKSLEPSDCQDLIERFFRLAETQCAVCNFADLNDLSRKIISALKARFSLKREAIDTRTLLLNGVSKLDFAIFAATEKERLALCNAFEISPIERIYKDTRTYWHKRLPLPNGQHYEILITQAPEMANVDAALLAADTLNHWQPHAILMVGIAAAAHPAQKLGDLILGKDIYYYERGKVTADGTLPEPVMYRPDATLWNRVSTIPKTSFDIWAARPDGTNTFPSIYEGVIACGEKVVADAAFRGAIARQHRKIKAIEMEGYGVSAAAWQRFEPVRCLVVRALCDYADAEKNDDWHEYAAAVAAGFTKHFLMDMPLEPRN